MPDDNYVPKKRFVLSYLTFLVASKPNQENGINSGSSKSLLYMFVPKSPLYIFKFTFIFQNIGSILREDS